MPTTIQLFVETGPSGRPVFEEVLVEPRGPETYELLASPGLVLGLAAGDVFRAKAGGHFELLTRSRNLCIQVFRSAGVDVIEHAATAAMSSLGGRHDGESRKQLVYTVPVAVGFPAVEKALASIVDRYPDVEWLYGNVYDPVDGVTPLNWWK